MTKYLNNISKIFNLLSIKRKKSLTFLFLISLLSAVFEVINLIAISGFLDIVVSYKSEIINTNKLIKIIINLFKNQNTLLIASLFLIFTVLFNTFLRAFTQRLQYFNTARIGHEISKRVFSSMIHKPYIWHVENNTSNLISNLTKDMDQVVVATQSALAILINIFTLLAVSISLIIYSPFQTIYTLISLLISYLFIYYFTRRKLEYQGGIMTKEFSKSIKKAQEALRSVRDIILDRNHKDYIDNYSQSVIKSRLAHASVGYRSATPRIYIEGIALIIFSCVILIIVSYSNNVVLIIPNIGTLLVGFYRIINPIQQCFIGLTSLEYSLVSIRKITAFFKYKPQINNINKRISIDKYNSKNNPYILLKSVFYKYPNAKNNALENINLEIRKGQNIGIVGKTGSGKSTLIDILLGLLLPTKGSFEIKGEKINDPSLVTSWQEEISHVPQKIFIKDSTILENIVQVKDSYEKKYLQKILEETILTEFIESLPDGINTNVGEDGSLLSGGQRQRIGIARALYRKPYVLILDEGTNSLDQKTEIALLDNLRKNKSITLITVTHRISTLKNFDSIVIINDNKIINMGTFEYLSKNDQIFRSFLI